MPAMDGFKSAADPAGRPGTRGAGGHGHIAGDAGGPLLAVGRANDFTLPIDETSLRPFGVAVEDEGRRRRPAVPDGARRDVARRTASLRQALDDMAKAQRLAYVAQLNRGAAGDRRRHKDKVTARHIRRMSGIAVVARG